MRIFATLKCFVAEVIFKFRFNVLPFALLNIKFLVAEYFLNKKIHFLN